MKPNTFLVATILAANFLIPIKAATIDQNWESRFVLAPGLNGNVLTLLGAGTNLYAGGAFTTSGVPETAGIARWDGTKWNSVGGGINGTVFALVTDGTNIFAGGRFNLAGGQAATNIAKWNGTNWTSIGALYLPDSPNYGREGVYSLIFHGTNLYAGGAFYFAGGTLATNVARWDGQDWHALGDGLGAAGSYDNFVVYSLAIHGGKLYAAGQFPISGAVGVTNIAAWTGSIWEQIGGGLSGGSGYVVWSGGVFSGYGQSLCSTSDGLLVGGNFTKAGGTTVSNIARWDGTNWSPVGVGSDRAINRILPDDTNQIVLGDFAHIGGIAANGVATLSGSIWSALGQGVIPTGIAATRVGTNLYVGGAFQIAGGQSAGFVSRWDGTSWLPLLPGECTAPSEQVNSLTFGPNGDLYAAGGFQTVGEVQVNGVARYDGTNWSAFGGGFPELNVQSIAVVGTNVYVKGYFIRPANGITNLARWNGAAWVALGSGVGNNGYSPSIDGIATSTSNLFVTGYFNTAGGMPATNLASWNGSQWSAIPLPPSIFCATGLMPITTQGDDLLVCHQGNCFFGNPTQVQVKKWNGTQWMDIGSSFSLADVSGYPNLQSMVCIGTNIFIAGHFAVTNEFLATNLVYWNGLSWTGVNHPFGSHTAFSPITHDGTNLFVAINAYGVPPWEAKIAKWNGTNWKVLGAGLTAALYGPQVSSLAMRGRDLFVGGYFSSAGGKPANYLALWHDFPEVTLAGRGWQLGGTFGLRVLGANNQPVQVQVSTNLHNWSDLVTLLPTSDSFDFEDSTTNTSVGKYYRLRLIP